jgi:hypothetical protein
MIYYLLFSIEPAKMQYNSKAAKKTNIPAATNCGHGTLFTILGNFVTKLKLVQKIKNTRTVAPVINVPIKAFLFIV